MKVMSWSASIPFACCRQETQKTVRRPRDCRFNLVFRSSSRSCCKVTGTAAAKGSFPQSGMVDGAFKSLRGIYASSGNSKGKTVSASAKSDQGFDQEDEDGPSEPASGWPAEECAPGMVSACMVAAAVFGVAAAADIGVLPGCHPAGKNGSLVAPMLSAVVLSALSGKIVVPLLRKLRASQTVRLDGPRSHLAKTGTPTAGGLFVIPCGVLVGVMYAGTSAEVLVTALGTAALGAVGLVDDFLKIKLQSSGGLGGRFKAALQIAVGAAVAFAATVGMPGMLQVSLCLGSSLAVGQKLYAVLSVFTIVAESNGVNLTDGLDGLAAGTCALALTGMAVVLAPTCYPLAVFSCALAGAACGFLAYNHHVASCFMGDTGSLAFGGALGILAVLSGRFGQLLLVSGVFAAECLSVLLQVAWFKLTKMQTGKGQRLFRMAPLHHHLELSGWHETNVTLFLYAWTAGLSVIAILV